MLHCGGRPVGQVGVMGEPKPLFFWPGPPKWAKSGHWRGKIPKKRSGTDPPLKPEIKSTHSSIIFQQCRFHKSSAMVFRLGNSECIANTTSCLGMACMVSQHEPVVEKDEGLPVELDGCPTVQYNLHVLYICLAKRHGALFSILCTGSKDPFYPL